MLRSGDQHPDRFTKSTCGGNDARTIEKEMGIFTADEILNLEVGEAIARAGSSKTAFNLATSPPPQPPENDPTSTIVKMSRQRYAVHKSEIDDPVEKSQNTQQPKPQQPKSHQRKNQKKRRKSNKKRKNNSGNESEPTDPSEDDWVT